MERRREKNGSNQERESIESEFRGDKFYCFKICFQVRVEKESALTWGESVADLRRTRQNAADLRKNVKIYLNVDSERLKERMIAAYATYAAL